MTDTEASALRARIEAETDDDLVALDPRWEVYAQGELAGPEADALLREGEESELQALAADALAPLDDAAVGRITEFAGTHYRRSAEEGPPSSWRGWLIGLGALLAGVTAALLVVPRPAPDLVEYEPIWRSGEQDVRSEGAVAAAPTFVPGSRIQLDLRPATPPDANPTAVIALGDWSERVDVDVQITPYGVVRIAGVAGERPWRLDPGEYTLLVGLGPSGAPTPQGAPPEDWQSFALPFSVTE